MRPAPRGFTTPSHSPLALPRGYLAAENEDGWAFSVHKYPGGAANGRGGSAPKPPRPLKALALARGCG